MNEQLVHTRALTRENTSKVAARLVYWDAEGHWLLETVAEEEIPVVILEELIGEGRARIPQTPRKRTIYKPTNSG